MRTNRRCLALVAALLSWSLVESSAQAKWVPVHARLRQGVLLDGMAFVVDAEGRAWRVVPGEQRLTPIGVLPPDASPLASTGCATAWAVTTGPTSGAITLLVRVSPWDEGVLHVSPVVTSMAGVPEAFAGVGGADEDAVYLLPDGRIDRATLTFVAGHLEAFPHRRVIATARAAGETVYLTRDTIAGRLRVQARDGGAVEADLPECPGRAWLSAGEDLVLVACQDGWLTQLDARSLAAHEGGSPRLPPGRLEFLARRDAGWIAQVVTPSGPRDGTLWLIDGGLPAPARMLASAYLHDVQPFGYDGEQLWLAAVDEPEHASVVAVDVGAGLKSVYWVPRWRKPSGAGWYGLLWLVMGPLCVLSGHSFPFCDC